MLVVGLVGCGAFLLGAAAAHGFWALLLLLAAAGASGASVQSASGRAVMHWFAPSERGLALGIRQTAIPISGFAVAIALPPVVRAGGVGLGLRGAGARVPRRGALVGGLVLREGRATDAAAVVVTPGPLRDRRIWTLSIGSALVLAPQLCVAGFAVLFLHEQPRGLGERRRSGARGDAAARGSAGASPPGAGRTSRAAASARCARSRSRRRVARRSHRALVGGAARPARARCSSPPASLSMSWNSLSFAAAVELAGTRAQRLGDRPAADAAERARAPPIRRSSARSSAATSWRLGFAAVALLPARGLARAASIAR